MRPALIALLLTGSAACADSSEARERILLVTTTTVEDSGLLDALVASYGAAQDRYQLVTTAMASGAALEIGRRGDATVLVTHDPAGEAALLEAGHAIEQGPVMENDFVVAGPPADPARVAAAADAVAAFRLIGRSGSPFVSRGDESGTHRKERALWAAAGAAPWNDRPARYIEAGSGMAQTLQLASGREAYVLTDAPTLLHLDARLSLVPLVEDGERLRNPYTYTIPSRSPDTAAARDIVAWITGPGQDVIAAYGTDRSGEPWFRPTADPAAVRRPARPGGS